MLETLQQHATSISALASAGMFVIWTVYAWLFYNEFKRRRQCKLFIHPAGSVRVEPECLLVNLSQEPVHVLCSMGVRDGASVTLYDRSEEFLSIQARVKQGPLHAGESISLGSFDAIGRELDEATERLAGNPDGEQIIEIRVAAIHGAHAVPVGARRTFRWMPAHHRVIENMPTTAQMLSRRDSRTVQKWLDECSSRSN